jgi:hypothetical protein
LVIKFCLNILPKSKFSRKRIFLLWPSILFILITFNFLKAKTLPHFIKENTSHELIFFSILDLQTDYHILCYFIHQTFPATDAYFAASSNWLPMTMVFIHGVCVLSLSLFHSTNISAVLIICLKYSGLY